MSTQPAGVSTTLAQYVKAAERDAAFVAQCEARAAALVAQRVAGATVPAEILDLARLEVGADLFWRRSARNGVAGFDGADTVQPVRIARDPMRAADDLLRPFLGIAVA